MTSTSSTISSQPQIPTILAIETSCDETAMSIVRGFETVSHIVHSQAHLHAEFGGVFPNLAKREHIHNCIPVLHMVFEQAYGCAPYHESILGTATHHASTPDSATATHHSPAPDSTTTTSHSPAPTPTEHIPTEQSTSKHLSPELIQKVLHMLEREQGLGPALITYINSLSDTDFQTIRQSLDRIAVTYGPGLEPALWVGISLAKALSVIFDIPLMPINHMEGHIASVIHTPASENVSPSVSPTVEFPALALLISGGHTELVHISSWHHYQIIGHTVDDAVGEAYDKTARILGLPYPGGPEVSRLAEQYRQSPVDPSIRFTLPRPMIHSKDYHFSFSGLKTAVLYAVRDRVSDRTPAELTPDEKIALAGEFESAVIEVIISKTKKALIEHTAKSLIIGGGVISNTEIRSSFERLAQELHIALFLPHPTLTTDNATMIALVAVLQYYDQQEGLMPHTSAFDELRAVGNLQFS